MSAPDLAPGAPRVIARARIEELLFSSGRVSSWLQRSAAADWLREHPAWTRALWRDETLVGLLACTPPVAGNCWLHICALRDGAEARAGFAALWQPLRATLQQSGVRQDWLGDCLPPGGFSRSERIVTLRRAPGGSLPRVADSARIRPACDSDLDALCRLDAAAFPPRWHMPAGELRRALRHAACFTVLVETGCVRGFQFTTQNEGGAHLARLAIEPQRQGAGLGTQLLGDLVRRLQRRNCASLTVNTQAHNQGSLRLYRRFGFRRIREDYTVWSQQLAPAAQR